MSEPVLAVDNLIKDYGDYRAIDKLSFSIKKGEVLGLLGPNGAGKSTTIQILVGITTPSSGKISYFGDDFAKYKQRCLQRINFASAYNTLLGRITVKENLLVFARAYKVKKPDNTIAELLDYFEITRFANHKYWDLSAGERTRVNLAKSLLNNPDIILMDEPTASLDPDIADKTLTLIEDLRARRKLSILFTSHNMAEVSRVCDQVIFLDKGKMVSKDTPTNHVKRLKGVELRLIYKGDEAKLCKILNDHKIKFELVGHKLVSINTTHERVAETISKVVNGGIDVVDTEVNKPTLEDVFLEVARGDNHGV